MSSQNTERDFEDLLAARVLDLEYHGSVALQDLYDVAASRLLRYALLLTRSRHEAEDLLQNCFLKIAQSPQKVARSQFPWRYLLRMIRNDWCDRLRGTRVVSGTPEDEAFSVDESVWDSWERNETVELAMCQLPRDQAEVITLRIWEGLTYREIADVTDESINTVASRYRYGLDRLAKLLGHRQEKTDGVGKGGRQ